MIIGTRSKEIIKDLIDLLSVYEPNEDYLKELLITDVKLADDELEDIGIKKTIFTPKMPTDELSLEIIRRLEQAIHNYTADLIELVFEDSDIRIVASDGDNVSEEFKCDRMELDYEEEKGLIAYVEDILECGVYKKGGFALLAD